MNEAKVKLNEIKKNLPKDYLDFLKTQKTDIIENDINYLVFWYEDELIQFNDEYQVQKYAPNLFFIASNGGGAGLAYNLLDYKLYSVPFIGLSEEDAVLIAENFTELMERFGKEELEIY